MGERAPPSFRRILVPVDGSANSKKASEVAIGLAKKYGAKLTLFHVVVTPASMITAESMAPFTNLNEYWAEAREEAEKFQSAIVAMARASGIEVETKIADNFSSAVQAIVEQSEKVEADLIVMGTRGMGGFKRMLLGSVSSGVVGHAHCSVLVVR
jgi:nucleotide-binding universal stress UspA family protein